MKKSLLIIFLLSFNSILFSQKVIGEIDGIQILGNDNYYEIIFKTPEEGYSSFYIENNSSSNGYDILKKYIFQLFKSKEKDGYLLQFVEDSVLLKYNDNKVELEIWREHDGDIRINSKAYTLKDYLLLFGLSPTKNSF